MEEKILATLMEMNEKFEKKFEQMDQKMDGLKQELNQNMNEFKGELNQDMNNFKGELYLRMDNLKQELHKEILDQHFLFESEYGTKIDAIFDSVSLELDKNLEKSQKIRRLSERMDRNEVTVFGHEKRISSLELKK